jgi:hypothetical protein
MFKKIIQIILICFLLVVIIFLLKGGKNTWVCENGEWIKQGRPSELKPTEPCLVKETELIKLFSPQAGAEISTPLQITGEARGTWFFEADFPVYILNAQREVIAQGIAQAQDDWMTEDFIPFNAVINFSVSEKTEAMLILKKDNPSGLKENDDQIEIPITLVPLEKMTVDIYFSNKNFDDEIFCNKVFPIKREIPYTKGVARAALQELFKGLTEKEKDQGYFNNINEGVEIQSIVIEEGVAYVDFNEQLEYQVGGSCLTAAIRAQIAETLKQFDSVDEVVISVNDRVEDVLQP